MSAFGGKADAANPVARTICRFAVCSLFELRRSVPLDLFYQGGPDALEQPKAIRGHGQGQFGCINPL